MAPSQRSLRPVLLGSIMFVAVVLKIVALSPSSLEESGSHPLSIDLDELILKEDHTLAPGIPKGQVPDYSIDQFNYVSTRNSEKEWNLIAKEAFFFSHEHIVHARTVRALLYDSEGKVTVITGLEAKYLQDKSDLEVYGDVKATLPDGFVVNSQYMRYKPKEKRIDIPESYPAEGEGKEQQGQLFHFNSQGLEFATEKGDIYLPAQAKVDVIEEKSTTTVLSDHCLIHRKTNIAEFTMRPEDSDARRFVQINQPTLYARGRSGILHYGSAPHLLQNMTLFDDVFVQEFTTEKESKPGTSDKKDERTVTRYGTGGRGDFDSLRNVVILTIYPQVYQDDDTVTGDKITLHRDSDIVEVEHSNGFSKGNDDLDSE